jgi:hypothetical protein
VPVEGRTCARVSQPELSFLSSGTLAFSASGRAKNASLMAKAWRISSLAMPWLTIWKKPISADARHSSSAISDLRRSKSPRSISGTGRSLVSLPSVPMWASLLSSFVA